jgi:MFS family permease
MNSRVHVEPRAAPRGTAAFRHRNFTLFWFGQLVSLAGTWMQSVAQGWLVLQLTNDPFALGAVAAIQFTPVLVFGLFGGVIADAFPKHTAIVLCQTAMMVLALVLAVLTATGLVQVWHIVVLAFCLGLVNTVEMPTRQAFVIEMVGREDIANAVALNSAAFNSARVVGPAIGGLIIAFVGIAACFLLNAISYLAVIAALLAMRKADLVSPDRVRFGRSPGAVIANLAEGLVYVRRTPVVLLAVSVLGLVSAFGMNFNVLVPVVARDVLGAGASGFGFLMAAVGLGSVTAALGLAFVGRAPPRAIIAGAALLGVVEMALAAVRVFPVAMVGWYLAGFGAIGMAATCNSVIQLAVPDALRGRIMAVYTTVFAGSTPIGNLFTGGVTASFGAPVTLLVSGGASLFIAIVALVLARPWLGNLPAVVDPGERKVMGPG